MWRRYFYFCTAFCDTNVGYVICIAQQSSYSSYLYMYLHTHSSGSVLLCAPSTMCTVRKLVSYFGTTIRIPPSKIMYSWLELVFSIFTREKQYCENTPRSLITCHNPFFSFFVKGKIIMHQSVKMTGAIWLLQLVIPFPSFMHWCDPSQARTGIWTQVPRMRGGRLTNWAISPPIYARYHFS